MHPLAPKSKLRADGLTVVTKQNQYLVFGVALHCFVSLTLEFGVVFPELSEFTAELQEEGAQPPRLDLSQTSACSRQDVESRKWGGESSRDAGRSRCEADFYPQPRSFCSVVVQMF